MRLSGSSKKAKKKKRPKKVEEELNIRYHDVNPQWNYTISPRPKSKQTKGDEK